mmetsp:Transcript_26514/g.49990  ORF Transcript_26514/g.49990 Transcript_26514/m.49990 type:complete len:392 (-) Transcript_26514:180-1355(-)
MAAVADNLVDNATEETSLAIPPVTETHVVLPSRECPVPRPLSEAEIVPITPTQSKGPHRLLAYYLIHSARCLGHVPWLALAMKRKPKQVLAALLVYYGFRRTDSWNTAVHRLIRFGSSNRPRFIKARRVPYDRNKQYVVSVHPHGVLLCSWFNWLGREETPSLTDSSDRGFSSGIKALDGLVTNLCFAPAVQHYMLHGEMYRDKVTDAQGATMRRILQRTKDSAVKESVCVCPGGFSEAAYTGYSDKYDISYIKSRYGVMKVAIEAGIDIIPTYSFGASDMYWGWDWKRHERAKLSQKVGLPMVVWSGKCGTNVPYFEDTATVCFDPFPSSAYSLDEVELAHEHYCEYLKRCFDAYKGCCEASKNKELVFVGKDDPPPAHVQSSRAIRSAL